MECDLVYRGVLFDVVERFGEINEDRSDSLILVNSLMSVMHYVHQHVRRRSPFQAPWWMSIQLVFDPV